MVKQKSGSNLASAILEKRLTERYQALMGFSDAEIGLIASMYSGLPDGWEEFDLGYTRGVEAC